MVWVPEQLVGAPLGTTVKLQCHIESSPRAISYWAFDDQMVSLLFEQPTIPKSSARYSICSDVWKNIVMRCCCC